MDLCPGRGKVGRSRPPLQPQGWEPGTRLPPSQQGKPAARSALAETTSAGRGRALSVPHPAGARCGRSTFQTRGAAPSPRAPGTWGAGAPPPPPPTLGPRSLVAGGLSAGNAVSPSPFAGRRGRRTARGEMAAAGRARGWAPRSVLPLLRLLLLLPPPPAGCATARDPAVPARLSLHPPYFNLAEAARIWATATCGEREPGGARPRPELYCKLVGGPTVSSSGHTIQVRSQVPPGRAPSPRGPAPWAKGSGPFPALSGPEAAGKGSPNPCATPQGRRPREVGAVPPGSGTGERRLRRCAARGRDGYALPIPR